MTEIRPEEMRKAGVDSILLNRESHITRVLGGTGVFRKASWDAIQIVPENAEAITVCKAFDPKTMNLYLWGKCGRGKTLLAKAIARQWMFEGMSAAIESTHSIAWSLAEDVHRSRQIFDRLATVDLFVLNDIGSGAMGENVFFLLCDILESRADQDRQGFIVTSNFSMSSLAAKMGDDRLPSRMQMCQRLEVRGPDWRRQ